MCARAVTSKVQDIILIWEGGDAAFLQEDPFEGFGRFNLA